MSNKIPIEGTDLHLWLDTHSWVIGKVVKCKATEKTPEGIKTTSCSYHATSAQAVAEVFNRKVKALAGEAHSLAQIRDIHAETMEWIKGLFPELK